MTDGDAGGITRNGLRVDLAKQQAWQLRGAEAYAARRRARKSAARLTSRIDRRPRPAADWPAGVRELASLRSGGTCELCREQPAAHLHHRKPRRFGDHRIVNALHVCVLCHGFIHGHPSTAKVSGWIVSASGDPAAVPVVATGVEGWIVRLLPGDDGSWRMAA